MTDLFQRDPRATEELQYEHAATVCRKQTGSGRQKNVAGIQGLCFSCPARQLIVDSSRNWAHADVPFSVFAKQYLQWKDNAREFQIHQFAEILNEYAVTSLKLFSSENNQEVTFACFCK